MTKLKPLPYLPLSMNVTDLRPIKKRVVTFTDLTAPGQNAGYVNISKKLGLRSLIVSWLNKKRK